MTDIEQAIDALGNAMDKGRPFSWLMNRPTRGYRRTDVQCGVYLTYTQQHFQQYEMRKRAAKLAGQGA